MTAGASRRIRWKKAADDDLAEIVEYIANDSPQAAERFLDDLLSSIETLASFPYTGSIYPRFAKARQLVFGSYVIYYTVATAISADVAPAQIVSPLAMLADC